MCVGYRRFFSRDCGLSKGTGHSEVHLSSHEHRSFQFKFAAVESHHLVQVRDAKLVHFRSVILADVDCIFGCLCNPLTSQNWCFTYPEEWEFVACLQVASVAINCDANFT